ncbi:MAG: tyrosine-type recombinase/integrase [Leptospiraceae bacterium]|nr:tyrosine-type recombinase/integrase [Leptospiraceae bacterium]MCP5510363.1 tyrosine-type recombinase/integrase [Leptospiraceae bacterium]
MIKSIEISHDYRFVFQFSDLPRGFVENLSKIPGSEWGSFRRVLFIPLTPDSVCMVDTLSSADLHLKRKSLFVLLDKVGRERKKSIQTIFSYRNFLEKFFHQYSGPLLSIQTRDLMTYLENWISEKDPADSTYNLCVSSFHFFFREILGLPVHLELRKIHKSASDREILSRDEVRKILDSPSNLKHRTLLSLVYNSGLRVSEVVTIRREDLDRNRKLLFVESPPGTRVLNLCDQDCLLLEEYLSGIDNSTYLFPGQEPLRPLSIRAAEKIFELAKNRAGVRKNVSIHSLRHSYACHLLENGINEKKLQYYLGHRHIQSTQAYRKVVPMIEEDTGFRKVGNS